MFIELLIAALAIVISIAGAVGLYGSRQITKRRTPDVRTDPADYGLSYEEVAFKSRDGLILRGWFIPAAEPRGTIVFCHGHGGSMDPDIEYAPAFHDRGYNVLMFDFRGHGRSEGQRVSMGYHERLDLLGAVDYLKRRGIDRVGVLGFSMGGAVAISTAPQSEAIRAVVSDGAFTRLGNAIARGARERGLPGWVAAWASPLMIGLASLRLGAWLPRADPIRWVAKITPRALFIIHGGLDPYVSLGEVQELYAKAGQPKELWVVPEVSHRMVDKQHPDEYRAKLLAFFDKWL
ncbi:MAG: alpha/beta hydrolase [Chloroflexi bacterium]|nr:alpha/beta hydrolase [Chloroflexota bacterium]